MSDADLAPGVNGRLHRVFAGLSLDMADDALQGFGVPPASTAAVRDAIRRALGAPGSPPPSPDDEPAVVAAILDALDVILGAHDAGHVKSNLVDAFFDPENDGQMFLWEQIAHHGGRDDEAAPSSHALPEIVRRMRADAASPGPRSPSTHLPSTDHDRAQLVRYGHDDPAEADEGLGPMTELDNAVDRIDFLRGFRRAVAAAEDREAELDALLVWGREAAEALGMPGEMIERPAFVSRPAWPPSNA